MAKHTKAEQAMIASATTHWMGHARSYGDCPRDARQFHAGAMHAYARVVSEITGNVLPDVKVALDALFRERA